MSYLYDDGGKSLGWFTKQEVKEILHGFWIQTKNSLATFNKNE